MLINISCTVDSAILGVDSHSYGKISSRRRLKKRPHNLTKWTLLGRFTGKFFFAKVFLVPNVDTVVKAKLIHLCNTSNVLNKYKSMDADFWQGGCLQWRIEYMSMVSQCPINHH